MPNLGITEYVHKVDDTPQHALGTRVVVPARAVDALLYYVDGASGEVIGGAQEWFQPPAGAEEVELVAGSGDMEWVYVLNGSSADIERGEAVMFRAGAADYDVEKTAAAATSTVARCPGIAQHQIPEGKCGWVLAKGVGKALVAQAAIMAPLGQRPSTSAAGVLAALASAPDTPLALVLEDRANSGGTLLLDVRVQSLVG